MDIVPEPTSTSEPEIISPLSREVKQAPVKVPPPTRRTAHGFSSESRSVSMARQDFYKKLKAGWFDLLFLGSVVASAEFFREILGGANNASHWYEFIIALSLTLASFGFVSILFKLKDILILSFLASLISVFALWNQITFSEIIYLWIFPFLGMLFGSFMAKIRIGQTFKLRFYSAVKAAAMPVLIGFMMMYSVMYYNSLVAGGAPQKLFFGEDLVSSALHGGQWGVRVVYPDFSADMNIDQLIDLAIKHQTASFQSSGGNTPTQAQLIEARQQILGNISKSVGTTLAGNESISHVLYQFLSNKYGTLPAPNQNTALLVWIFLVFLALWSLAWFEKIIAAFLGVIMFQIFRGLKLVRVDLEPTEKQVMLIS